MTEADQQALSLLLDEIACRRVLSRYSGALDWRDAETLASIVWPDAEIDYGFFKGTGQEWVGVFVEIEKAAGRPFHLMVCERIAVNGNLAEAESLGIALTLETAEDGKPAARQYWGRYLDQLEKRGQEWRIRRRKYVVHGVFDVAIPPHGTALFSTMHVAADLRADDPQNRRFRR